ncbi:hypothetical protein Ae201684P_007932 [Aphanomyces euteiches]|uniref:Uncharacterized protein n=1 Tax=Aphanomyces euteiches TaxID=100861 RepID=A0A6G0WM67_9STRA|nr:hypothetical protein Ae201684_013760 [Aphanomyces euteiches]KAH9080846.1 hypothetical protein Ae201684P_007932 [Aphanomyces euteiches]
MTLQSFLNESILAWTVEMPSTWTNNVFMVYSTCIFDNCTTPVHRVHSASIITQSLPPSPLPCASFNASLHLVWTNASMECHAVTRIDPCLPNGKHPLAGWMIVVAVLGVVVLLVGSQLFWWHRREQLRKRQAAMMSVSTPRQDPTWFEVVYHNDAALPSSVLQDDAYTRAILRYSLPSGRDLSWFDVDYITSDLVSGVLADNFSHGGAQHDNDTPMD